MKNSKRGSSGVFMTMIVATLLTIVLAFMTGARNDYIISRMDGVINLAGDSVMSEFDYYVQREYGLFVLGGTRNSLEGKLRSYVEYNSADLGDVSVSNVDISGSGYSLANCQQIKEQLVTYMKYAQAEGILNREMTVKDNPNEMKEEVLRNGPTIVSLPSHDMPSLSITDIAETIGENLKGAENILKETGDNYLICRYVLSHFNNRNSLVSDEHFFKNEVEYVLGGKLSDKENQRRVEMALVAMRFPLNMKYLLTDQEKMDALLAVAEVLTPEAAPATQMILATSWAYLESDNDVELLWQGHRVPLNKDKLTWAVDIDGLIDGVKTGTFKPQEDKGQKYSDYLQMLLMFENSDIKIARIMDLIQINTRMNHDRTFVIGEHCIGMHMAVKAKGRNYVYEKKY